MWTDEDRAWAYALDDIERGTCPGGCGQPLDESARDGAEDDYDVHVYACHACAAKQRRMEESGVHGALVWVTPSGTANR